jgi:hypothetical protein
MPCIVGLWSAKLTVVTRGISWQIGGNSFDFGHCNPVMLIYCLHPSSAGKGARGERRPSRAHVSNSSTEPVNAIHVL